MLKELGAHGAEALDQVEEGCACAVGGHAVVETIGMDEHRTLDVAFAVHKLKLVGKDVDVGQGLIFFLVAQPVRIKSRGRVQAYHLRWTRAREEIEEEGAKAIDRLDEVLCRTVGE